MRPNEFQQATTRYHERVRAVLTPQEFALYEAYNRRLRQMPPGDTTPVTPSPDEQAVLDKLAEDRQAAALHKQVMVLIGAEKLPQ